MTWELRPSPNHAGNRQLTLGVVLHSTRGGAPSQQIEYQATLTYFASPNSQVSAHRVIGFDGNGAICVADDLIAWHAADHNARWLGVELTEPTINDPYSAEQYQALAGLLQEWSAQYGFPLDREHLVAHSEINGQKTDPGPLFDWDRIMSMLGDDSMNQAQLDEIAALGAIADAYEQLFTRDAENNEATYGGGFIDTANRRKADEHRGFAERIRNLPNL